MRLRTTIFALLVAALVIPAAARTAPAPAALTGAQIPNLDTVKAEIRTYYGSGEWNREVTRVTDSAQRFVDEQLAHHPHKPAVVLDIDDTALSDYGYEVSHDFGYDPRTYDADINAEAFPAIAPTLAFTRQVAAEGVAVFFITGRRTPERAVTIGNLRKVGYPAWQGLFLRPIGDHAYSIIPFKSRTRAQIQARGYTVLLSMGDQYSDLRGGHAERDFKLPN
ncbi:MAG: HAD family acid phosphatase, partial [Vulcanimicrobiaceae bacterium]